MSTVRQSEPSNSHSEAPPALAPYEEITHVAFDNIFMELIAFRNENNGSLTIPVTHPSFERILDTMTAMCVEDLVKKRWESQMNALDQYQKQNGDCDVDEYYDSLNKWVKDQRDFYNLHQHRRPNPLSNKSERIEKLTKVGAFVRKMPTLWDQRFEELRQYKESHGHCEPPIDYPHLGVWTLLQRFNLAEMPKERVEMLDSLGFNWNCNKRNRSDDQWNAQYASLVEFVKVHKHANVPPSYDKLGKWVKNQRYEYTKYNDKEAGTSKLNRHRIQKLEEIGFQWRVRGTVTVKWEERFEELKRFKEEHGHFFIPRKHTLLPWAQYHRAQYKLLMQGKPCKVRKEKMDHLIEIGFFDPLLNAASEHFGY
mmetsp:Transcript_9896/g.19228  ORF Transcript_9896/g.19228 Transcript_9896/m.19228 type:complete len:367 (-) Transcript_9896:194-1294(-)